MLPVIRGKDLVTFLEKSGFTIIRQKGSHVRMKSDDGRYTTIPVHTGDSSYELCHHYHREDANVDTLRNNTHNSG